MTKATDITGRLEALSARAGLPGLARYAQELEDDRALLGSLMEAVRDVPEFLTKSWPSPLDLGFYRAALYALCRATGPGLVIETGVLHGLTSAFILAALERNGHGLLVSIDAPSYPETGPYNRDGFTDVLPAGRQPGWVVPEASRRRWRLVIGPTSERLPEVLREHGPVDIFLHDSEHTYATMAFELGAAYPALRPGGLLVCDNVAETTAFFDLCHALGVPPVLLPAGGEGPDAEAVRFGLAVKPAREGAP